jgi:hypothetical protein
MAQALHLAPANPVPLHPVHIFLLFFDLRQCFVLIPTRENQKQREEGGKGKERKGKERKGKERKGKERKGKERKGKERKGKERKGETHVLDT